MYYHVIDYIFILNGKIVQSYLGIYSIKYLKLSVHIFIVNNESIYKCLVLVYTIIC